MPGAASKAVLRGVAVVASLAVILLLASCGGGGSDSSTAAAGSAQAGTEQAGAGSGFIKSFGEEASPGDRAAAASAVQEFLRAWADGDSARACSLMAASTKKNLAVFTSQFLKSSTCTEQLEALTKRIPAKTLAQAERIEVAGVRIEGDRAFMLYRDAQGTESAFPVLREGSAWKVGALRGLPLP